MNKNTIIGFVVIGVIMFGFSWYQSSQYKEQMQQEAQAASEQTIEMTEEALIASMEAEIAQEQEKAESVETAQPETVAVTVQELTLPYKDERLTITCS